MVTHNSCVSAYGEMLEWLKRHAWKACIRQKRIRGSNPRLSAGEKTGFKAGKAESHFESPFLRRRKNGVQSRKGRKPFRIPVSPQEKNDKTILNENIIK